MYTRLLNKIHILIQHIPLMRFHALIFIQIMVFTVEMDIKHIFLK